MSKNISDNSRLEAVKDLALLRQPIEECIKNIRKFDWDFDGKPYILKVEDLIAILKMYLDSKINEDELSLWAETIELREDIEYEENKMDYISNVIFFISTPEINEKISHDLVADFLNMVN